jgi:predicted RNA-binding Zn ribbon-like protein
VLSAEIPNGRAALERRYRAGCLTWASPAAMLFARSAFAVSAARDLADGRRQRLRRRALAVAAVDSIAPAQT